MSSFLIDTHVLLWWLADDATPSARAQSLLMDPEHTCHISAATIREIRIKEQLKKLSIPKKFESVVEQPGLSFLPITHIHANAVAKLPLLHSDPFDRMILAQADCERVTVLTHDAQFKKYKVPVVLV